MASLLPVALQTALLTAITMAAFAANSVLARLALRGDEIDGASFTGVRLVSGAAVLALLIGLGGERLSAVRTHGTWRAAFALFAYALAFSVAYLWLEAGAGALILFAAVQITMISAGILRGERPHVFEWMGLGLALGGLIYLVSPGLAAPPLAGGAVMAGSGVAWGVYSLAARGTGSPVATTAGNFVRAAPMAAAVLAAVWLTGGTHANLSGVVLAAISGGITSALAYALWYRVLKDLSATRAAIVQLSVPVLAAAAGVALLQEQMTWRLALAGTAILSGVALASSAPASADSRGGSPTSRRTNPERA